MYLVESSMVKWMRFCGYLGRMLAAVLLVLLQACAAYRPIPEVEPPLASTPPRQAAKTVVPATRPAPDGPSAADRTARPVTPPVTVERVTPAPAAANLMARAEKSLLGGDIDAALLWLERAQRLSPQAGDVYLAMGDAKERLGLLQEAEQLYLKALSLAGNDKEFKAKVDERIARVRRRQG